ncbi:MAG: hypothetical protein VKJ24_06545 [Synechococcales bacterium]|nr:hypothetical protein [Synechococcales bacterium]
MSHYGQTIASGGGDGTVKLIAWNLEELLRLACDHAQDYLRTSQGVSEGDRTICGMK